MRAAIGSRTVAPMSLFERFRRWLSGPGEEPEESADPSGAPSLFLSHVPPPVPLHRYDSEWVAADHESCRRSVDEQLDKVLARQELSLSLIVLAGNAHPLAGYATLSGERDEVRRALRILVDATRIELALSRGPRGPIDLPLGERMQRFDPCPGVDCPAHAWLRGFWAAVILRDPVARIELSLLRPSGATLARHDALASMAEALQQATLGDAPRALASLDRAAAAARAVLDEPVPDQVDHRNIGAVTTLHHDRAQAHNIWLPTIALIRAWLREDRADFVARLHQSQLGHREQHRWDFHRNMGQSFLSLPAIALVVLARERGWVIEPASDYIPAFLTEGEPPREPLLCCPYCVAPLSPGTELCPICAADTTRDAWLEFADPAAWSAAPRIDCHACGAPRLELAVTCPHCLDGSRADR